MRQIQNSRQNKKALQIAGLLTCNSKMVPLMHFVSNTFWGG